MKLVVGLGNPGKEYEKTRHNIGFMSIDYYCKNNNIELKKKFNGLYSIIEKENGKIILLKPQSFMNNSGDVVKKYVDYFKIDIGDILVIYDDIDFDIGMFKIKNNGSSGGHNGIGDIINKLKSKDIKRIRIGIGKNDFLLADYVLGKFNKKELEKITDILPLISNVIDSFISLDFERIMNKYNKKEFD